MHALYHRDFNADAQFGEVNGSNGQRYSSYWVDYWLARFYASPPGAPSLPLAVTGTATLQILPTQQSEGSVVITVANHAVHNCTQNNGTGDPRTVVVDVSRLGSFTTATALTLDATTNPSTGPSPVSVTLASRIAVTLNGCGVTFLTLKQRDFLLAWRPACPGGQAELGPRSSRLSGLFLKRATRLRQAKGEGIAL